MGILELRERVRRELAAALQARGAGNEGKARVCARRAAGWSIAPHKRSQEGARTSGNAYENLRWLQQKSSGAPARLQKAAGRLSARIRPDHTLPFEADPLQDALTIVRHFMDIDIASGDFEGPEGLKR